MSLHYMLTFFFLISKNLYPCNNFGNHHHSQGGGTREEMHTEEKQT